MYILRAGRSQKQWDARIGSGDAGRGRERGRHTVRIRVDPALCVGHNRCAAVAPELFSIDDDGYATAAGTGIVPPERREIAELAVHNCPEQAITLEEQ